MIPTNYLAVVSVKTEDGKTQTGVIQVCSAASLALIAIDLFERNNKETFQWGKIKEVKTDQRQIVRVIPTRDGVIGDTVLLKVNGKWAVTQEGEADDIC